MKRILSAVKAGKPGGPRVAGVARKKIEVIDDVATGKAMRALRRASGKTLTALAKSWSVSVSYLSDLELGKRGWSEHRVAQFIQLCQQ